MASFNVPVSLLNQYAEHIKADYRKWWGAKASEPHVQQMISEFGIDFEPGSSHIKVVKTKNGVVESVHSFICNKDGKFPKGAILKSASFKAPATNFARADVAKPETWVGHVRWTGSAVMRPQYFYQIEFGDGRVIRREYQTRSMAKAMGDTMVHEMLLFNVVSIVWGKDVMNLYELIEKVDNIADAFISKLEQVLPEDLGLDRRAAYRLWAGEDVIAVPLGDDRVLQYYGGFEYVEPEYRKQVGNWVFYSAESDRVAGCLERIKEEE